MTRTAAADVTGPPDRRGRWWIIGVGTVVATTALVLLPISQARIDSHRDGLREDCSGPVADDFCPVAVAGRGASAQGHVDGLATWKPIRTLSWVGLGVGLTSVAAGAILYIRDRSTDAPSAARITPRLLVEPATGRLTVGMGWSCVF